MRKALFVTFLLLVCIGTGAFLLAFWTLDHRQALPNSTVVIVVSLGVFFVSYTGAFMLFLRWRDAKRGIYATAAPMMIVPRADQEGTIYGLMPGNRYRVIRTFTDFYGNSFEQGTILQFKERHFLPYDGGHTIVFDRRMLYLQEEKNEEIVEHFSRYFEHVT